MIPVLMPYALSIFVGYRCIGVLGNVLSRKNKEAVLVPRMVLSLSETSLLNLNRSSVAVSHTDSSILAVSFILNIQK